MAHHIPGPWVAKPKPLDRLNRFMVLCMNDKRCPGTGKELVADNIRTAETACLIAAAPELLEALEGMLASRNSGEWADIVKAADNALAAIKKAKGQ